MNPVVHFEMPFDDKARLARFYEQAFGWQMQAMVGEDGRLRPRHDNAERQRRPAHGAGSDQRRLLPEEARLAGAGALGR